LNRRAVSAQAKERIMHEDAGILTESVKAARRKDVAI
jgi:hypothetical protein